MVNASTTGHELTQITGLKRWPGFLEGLWDIVAQGTRDFLVGERLIHACHNWFRDHIHMIKFARYFDADPSSALQFLIDYQHPAGFFHEILLPSRDPHMGYVDEQFRLVLDAPFIWNRNRPIDPAHKDNWALLRLELEADIEYLMVEGVARAWEANGDTNWLESVLPALARGLEYCLSHPDRYDTAYGLIKRPFTIDTWDFCWGRSTDHRGIDEATPMAIHYGDNAGVFAAADWLSARMRDESERDEWQRRAREIASRTNRLCWNGRFYTHQVLLQPVETGGPREEDILSLSNSYAINRGLTDHAQAASIIREYMALRSNLDGLSVAEWFTIYPPYPEFARHPMWDYVNGGIAPFIAGELAAACLNHGFEHYAVDILDRLYAWWKRDGALDFLYTRDGKPQGGGPRGWGAAAIGQAILEGVAGVQLNAPLNTTTLVPRWIALEEDEIEVTAGYPSSKYGVHYVFRHIPKDKTITLECHAHGNLHIAILLPAGKAAGRVRVGDQDWEFAMETVESSGYVRLAALPAQKGTTCSVAVEYA